MTAWVDRAPRAACLDARLGAGSGRMRHFSMLVGGSEVAWIALLYTLVCVSVCVC